MKFSSLIVLHLTLGPLLLWAQSVSAERYSVALDSPGDTHIDFNIIADDGFTFLGESEILNPGLLGGMTLEANTVGILLPFVQLNSIDIAVDDVTYSGTFGSSPVDYTLNIDSIRLQYANDSGPLASTSSVATIQPTSLSYEVLGSLVVPGGSLPISFSGTACCSFSGSTTLSVNADGTIDFVGFGIAIRFVANQPLGTVGGISYRMGTIRSTLSNESFTKVPEPDVLHLQMAAIAALLTASSVRGRGRIHENSSL